MEEQIIGFWWASNSKLSWPVLWVHVWEWPWHVYALWLSCVTPASISHNCDIEMASSSTNPPPTQSQPPNAASIIAALGNAFKSQTGDPMSQDRIAQLLIANMGQLTELARQGKLNQNQILQVFKLSVELCKWRSVQIIDRICPSWKNTQVSTNLPRFNRPPMVLQLKLRCAFISCLCCFTSHPMSWRLHQMQHLHRLSKMTQYILMGVAIQKTVILSAKLSTSQIQDPFSGQVRNRVGPLSLAAFLVAGCLVSSFMGTINTYWYADVAIQVPLHRLLGAPMISICSTWMIITDHEEKTHRETRACGGQYRI